MGSDQLFYKNKQRKLESLKRRASMREPFDVILIVCEGKKTEPYYFKGLCRHLRLTSANIKIIGKGCDPKVLADIAIEESEKEDYDKIYCVFDRDEHSHFNSTLQKINSKKGFCAITSTPCFEFWIILHFEYTQAHFKNGDEVIKRVKKHLPKYKKNDFAIFNILKNKTETAITYAKRLANANSQSNTKNPSTNVHILIEHLQNLQRLKP